MHIDEKINIVHKYIKDEDWRVFPLNNTLLWPIISENFSMFFDKISNKHAQSFLTYFHHKIDWDLWFIYNIKDRCEFIKFYKVLNAHMIPSCCSKECYEHKKCKFIRYLHYKNIYYYFYINYNVSQRTAWEYLCNNIKKKR